MRRYGRHSVTFHASLLLFNKSKNLIEPKRRQIATRGGRKNRLDIEMGAIQARFYRDHLATCEVNCLFIHRERHAARWTDVKSGFFTQKTFLQSLLRLRSMCRKFRARFKINTLLIYE